MAVGVNAVMVMTMAVIVGDVTEVVVVVVRRMVMVVLVAVVLAMEDVVDRQVTDTDLR